MKKYLNKLLRKGKSQRAQSLAEYAIILSFVAMTAVIILRVIGQKTNTSMQPVNKAME